MSVLANDFARRKEIDLHIILYGINPEIFYPLLKDISIYIPEFKFDNSKRFYSTIKRLIYLRKKIKSIEPDIILSFGEIWNSFTLIATFGLKVPIYISDRNQPNIVLGKFSNTLRTFLYPRATGMIAQTNIAKNIYFDKKLNDNIKVIGNPINNISDFNNIKRENQILIVGRLIKTKNHDRLIKLFSQIDGPDWKLIIVGDDAIKQKNKIKLQKLIKELKLENRVILEGKQSNIEKYYLKSKIFVFTSSSEGFPNVIGEAMSAGLPVVAYDCVAGPSEMIKDGENGYLIPLFDDELFKVKLEMLMKDSALSERMGKQAKEDIKKFDIKKISEEFYEFIFSIN